MNRFQNCEDLERLSSILIAAPWGVTDKGYNVPIGDKDSGRVPCS